LVRNFKLAYRLVAHQTMKQFPFGDVIAVFCAAILLIFGVARFSRFPRVAPVLAIVVVGFGVASLSSILVRGFDPLAPSYNIWMIPFITTAIAAGTVAGSELHDKHRWVLLSLFGLMMGMAAVGDWALAHHGPMYGHTRSQDLRRIVDTLGTENVTVIFVNDGGKTYLPMHYWYGDSLRQYVFKSDQLVSTLSNESPDELLKTPYMILVATLELSAAQLLEAITAGTSPD